MLIMTKILKLISNHSTTQQNQKSYKLFYFQQVNYNLGRSLKYFLILSSYKL